MKTKRSPPKRTGTCIPSPTHCARVLNEPLVLALAACTESSVVRNVEETQANRVVVAALDKAKMASEKEPDPSSEGRFRVIVGADDATRALLVLHDEVLPQPRPAGLLEEGVPGVL